jgi:hypothetical protein
MLNELKGTFEKLTSLIETFISRQENLDNREKLLNDTDFKLRDREKELDNQSLDITRRESELKSDRQTIDDKFK